MRRLTVILLLCSLVLAACGSDGDDDTVEAGGSGTEQPSGDAPPPAAGICLEGATDCDDTVDPGPPSDDGSADPEQPVSHDPAGGSDPADPAMDGAERVEPQGNTVNTRAHQWDSAAPTDDPSVVRVTFWGGVEPCFVLDHVDVEETPETVTITLWTGTAKGSEDVACIEIAKLYETHVSLSQPLGDRTVVDGAAAG